MALPRSTRHLLFAIVATALAFMVFEVAYEKAYGQGQYTNWTQIFGLNTPQDFIPDPSDPTLSYDVSLANALRNKARLFCWANSLESRIPTSLRAINETWIPRCDDHVFFLESTNEVPHDVRTLGVKDGREYLIDKSALAWKYVYQHYLKDFDWFLQGDEDTFLVVENLRFLLSRYDPNKPVYLGFIFAHEIKEGFMSGGASYILSREALRRLVEDAFNKNLQECPQHSDGGPRGHTDDLAMGQCMAKLGIAPSNTVDKYGRHSFHTHNPLDHITGTAALETGILAGGMFPQITGRNCCSELSISFHYVTPDQMRVMDHLLYRTTVYGRIPVHSKLEDMFSPNTVDVKH